LYTAARLIRESQDAVSQVAVARRSDMDPSTVSDVLRRLERKGLVDRAPCSVGMANRVLVTRAGQALLDDSSEAVAAFSLHLAQCDLDE
jgi:DNA-binding MarR family transcriptional regulator